MNERIQELAARVRLRESSVITQREFSLYKASLMQQSAADLFTSLARALGDARNEFNAALTLGSYSEIEFFDKRVVANGVKLIRGRFPAVNLTVRVDPENQRITVVRILTDETGEHNPPLEVFPLKLDDNTVRISDGTRFLTEKEFAEEMIEYFGV